MGKFFNFNPFRSITMAGIATLAINTALQVADPNALTPQGHQVVQVAGVILSILGIRRAQGPRQ